MKRIIGLLLLAGVFFALSVFGGAKRITRWEGTIIDTMINSDSTTRLSEKFVLVPAGDRDGQIVKNVCYDEAVFNFYIPDMDSIKCTGDVNAVDSVIMRLIAGTGTNAETLLTYTVAALPATFELKYINGAKNDSSKIFDVDSSIGYGKTFRDSTSIGLLHDALWFSAYVVDSAGSGAGDSLRYTIQWSAKFIER